MVATETMDLPTRMRQLRAVIGRYPSRAVIQVCYSTWPFVISLRQIITLNFIPVSTIYFQS